MEDIKTITLGTWLKNSLIGYLAGLSYCGVVLSLLGDFLGKFKFHLVLIVGLTVGWYQLKALRQVHEKLNTAWAWTYPLGFVVAYLFSLFFNEFTDGEFPQDILHGIRVILGTCVFGFFQARILTELKYKGTYVYFVTTVVTGAVIPFFNIFYYQILNPLLFNEVSNLTPYFLIAIYAVFVSIMSAIAMQYIQKQTFEEMDVKNELSEQE